MPLETTTYIKCGDKDCEKVYKFKRVLGQGSFACVKLAEHRENKSVWAVKILKKEAMTESDAESLNNEMSIVQQVVHPNIVATKEVYDTPHFCYVVMECMKGGELFDRIVSREHYSELEGKEAFSQMLQAILYCHNLNIVHRDLKPENLLYDLPTDDAKLKLADFGLAQVVKPDEMMHHACGTPGYIAPEVLNGEAYTKAVDMWSLGVILYILICGFPPFYDEDETALFRSIKTANYEFISPYWDDASPDVLDLIQKCLELDVSKRITAKEALEHPWLSGDYPHKITPNKSMVQQLKKYNARRRLKGAVRAVMVAVKMKDIVKLKDGAVADSAPPVKVAEEGIAVQEVAPAVPPVVASPDVAAAVVDADAGDDAVTPTVSATVAAAAGAVP